MSKLFGPTDYEWTFYQFINSPTTMVETSGAQIGYKAFRDFSAEYAINGHDSPYANGVLTRRMCGHVKTGGTVSRGLNIGVRLEATETNGLTIMAGSYGRLKKIA